VANSPISRARAQWIPSREQPSAFEESIRILRSNLDVALMDIRQPTVVVTSANPNEGKTVISSNLAISLAAARQRVVLVDMDLRHPNIHKLLGAHNQFGVAEVLLGQRPLDEALQYIELPPQIAGREQPGLYFLGTGAQVPNPTELLDSGRTARLLERLAEQADLVLLDTPPVLPVADTLVLGRMASGAIIVTESRRTAITAVQKAKELLIRNQTRLLGVVINKFHPRYADYGYGYGYEYGYGNRRPGSDDFSDDLLAEPRDGRVNSNGADSHPKAEGAEHPV
jgi:capsular exopolysaccharide synthesis family protein